MRALPERNASPAGDANHRAPAREVGERSPPRLMNDGPSPMCPFGFGTPAPGQRAGDPGLAVQPATLAEQHEHSVWMKARSEGVGSRPSGRRRYTDRRIGSAPSRRKLMSSPRLSSSATTSSETNPMPRPAATERLMASLESSSQRLAGR